MNSKRLQTFKLYIVNIYIELFLQFLGTRSLVYLQKFPGRCERSAKSVCRWSKQRWVTLKLQLFRAPHQLLDFFKSEQIKVCSPDIPTYLLQCTILFNRQVLVHNYVEVSCNSESIKLQATYKDCNYEITFLQG